MMADKKQKAVIDQIYDKLNELFGVQNQLFCMEFPGRVLDENTYNFKTDSIYSTLTKPQPVVEQEFRLTDNLLDVAQITGGPNGSKLSDTYLLVLNNLLPKYVDIPEFDNDKAKMRTWLLEDLDTEVNGKAVNCTRMQLYEMLNQTYLTAKENWETTKNTKLRTAQEAENSLEALEEYSRWLANEAAVKEAELENFFADAVVRGYYHEVREILGYLDVASESELLEQTKARMRNSSMSSLDESETIYPVQMQPTDWFKSLSTDFKPKDLLLDSEFIQNEIITKERNLASLQAEYQRMSSDPTGNIDELKKEVAQAQTAFDQAQTNMLEHFSSVTITIVKWAFAAAAKAGEDVAVPELAAVNAALSDKGESPLSDEQWDQLSKMQEQTIKAQAALTSSSRALVTLQADVAAAESTDTKKQLIGLSAQIQSLQAEIVGLKAVMMSQFSSDGKANFSYALTTAILNQLVTDKALTAAQKPKLATMASSAKAYDTLNEFMADIQKALTTAPSAALKTALEKYCGSKVISMVPSEMPPVGQFFDVLMSFDKSVEKDSSTLSKGSSESSFGVDFLFGSVGGSSSKAWSDFKSSHMASSSSFQIGMRVTKVTIDRGGWFNPTLLKATKNMFALDEKNKVSLGAPVDVTKITTAECENLNTGLFPSFPTSFIIAKDVTIKVSLSESEAQTANSYLQKSSSVSGGFLCFSASHASTSTNNSKSFYSGTSGTDLIIRIPGPQILGWYLEFIAKDESSKYDPMPPNYLPKDSQKASTKKDEKGSGGTTPNLEEAVTNSDAGISAFADAGKQVYLALHDDMSNYIISRKRCLNNFWHGAPVANSTVVNQAGQWSLPGGQVNRGESAGPAAVREFLEETGVDLSGYLMGRRLIDKSKYILMEMEVSPQQLVNINNQINANIQPNAVNANRPAGANVRDWELQATDIQAAPQLINFLGVQQAIPAAFQARVNQRRAAAPHSQAIDWYAAMANLLQFL